MNLVLDVGNSFGKMVLYKGEDVVFRDQTPATGLLKKLEKLFLKHHEIEHCILCAVGAVDPKVVPFLRKNTFLLEVSVQMKLPFENSYETPETLGADRIGLLAAAVFEYPDKNCLIIDAGSCVTYDFVSAKGQYIGGAISPGLQMRFKAMNEHTNKLPLIMADDSFVALGNNTHNSLLAGAVNGLVYEIDGWCNSLSAQYEDLTIILTGGDTQFLSKRLKNTIFANYNFLVDGLRQLLDYNNC
jgi:type III pantothenate kinase